MEELAAEIVSFKDCLGQKESKSLWGIEEPGPADIQPPRSKTPRRGRRDTSADRNLTKAREAHCGCLGEGNRATEPVHHLRPARGLCPLPELGSPQKKILGQNRRCHQVQPEQSPAPFFENSPPWRGSGSGEDEEAELALLEALLE